MPGPLRLIVLVVLVWTIPPLAAAPGAASPDGASHLQAKYGTIRAALEDNVFGVPIYLESIEDGGLMRGDIYGVIDHGFDTTARIVSRAQNWCDIIPLHFNVKVCTYRKVDGEYILTIYSGRKFYEDPESTYIIRYRYSHDCTTGSYCGVTLTADEGPLDTSDYRIQLEAIPLEDGRSFAHFSYSYRFGLLTDIVTIGYFATLGSGKVGFSTAGTDEKGNPVYVSGVQGVIERNSMRYYLAVQAFLDTLEVPTEERFVQRLSRWFDMTERYRRQLHEMSRAEYLDYKRREHADQIRLQRLLDGRSTNQSSQTSTE